MYILIENLFVFNSSVELLGGHLTITVIFDFSILFYIIFYIKFNKGNVFNLLYTFDI